jgi:transcriptional regulator with XRE-family HTH domain/mannose-6-phosphate isomerase-like protein (cupin superfamily)
VSSIKKSPSDLNKRIAKRVCELRAGRNLSLDALANRSGVSRSMLSLIERGESSPTAVVLEKVAAGLHVTLASLFDEPKTARQTLDCPVASRVDQPEWKDPGSGYRRRNVSPSGVIQPMQIVEVHFPGGARVAFESGVRDQPVYQQIWVLQGSMNITVGSERHRLREGDCLAMQLNHPTLFHNPSKKVAHYAVVISSKTQSRR